MDSPQYGSSGINWERTDPKTVTLSNVPPETQAPPPSQDPSPVAREMFANMMGGNQMTENELKHFQTGMEMRERRRGPDEDQAYYSTGAKVARREWRKQIRQFDRGLRRGDVDPQQGIQQLMDSGAIWLTPEGDLYSAVPLPEEHNQRLLDAARRWAPPSVDDRQLNMPESSAGKLMEDYMKKRAQMPGVMGMIDPRTGMSDQPATSTDEWRQRYENQFGR